VANLIRNAPEPPKNRLVFNTKPAKAELVERAHKALEKTDAQDIVLDRVSYHIQQAMQEIRDDPCGSYEFEKYCNEIYHHLYVAMNIVVAGVPKPPSCLQSDLDDVMGGVADGTTDVSEVQNRPPTTSE